MNRMKDKYFLNFTLLNYGSVQMSQKLANPNYQFYLIIVQIINIYKGYLPSFTSINDNFQFCGIDNAV